MGTDRLTKHFETNNPGFGSATPSWGDSRAILQYLDITQHTQLSHITSLAGIEEDRYVRLISLRYAVRTGGNHE